MATEGKYRDVSYESEDELWFLFWAFELHNKHIISSITRAPTYNLTEGLDHEFVIKDSKGREVTKRQQILRPSVYTPEFVLIWDMRKPEWKQFVWRRGWGKIELPLIGFDKPGPIEQSWPLLETIIEVKPDFDQNNMTRLFKINQKFLWDKHKVFVNLVKCKELFEKTFTPAEFLKTRTGKDRKLNYEPITIEQYLNGRSENK